MLQSATLAGLIQAPSTYDPVHHPDEALARRNVVLQDMAEQGYISQSDAIDLSARPVKVRKRAAARRSTRPLPTSPTTSTSSC